MYEKIKTLADEALRVQNKLQMEQALRDISALCAAACAPSSLLAPQGDKAQQGAADGSPAVATQVVAQAAAKKAKK